MQQLTVHRGSQSDGCRKFLPAYLASLPSSSSIRSIWLYLAKRSERQGAPVFIWNQLHTHIILKILNSYKHFVVCSDLNYIVYFIAEFWPHIVPIQILLILNQSSHSFFLHATIDYVGKMRLITWHPILQHTLYYIFEIIFEISIRVFQ